MSFESGEVKGDDAFFARRAAIAAVLLCPLGAVLALAVEGIVLASYTAIRTDNEFIFEPSLFIGMAIWGVIVTILVTAADFCVVLPLAVCYPLSHPPKFSHVVFPVTGISLVIATAASAGLWWDGETLWVLLFVPYCLLVIPATSAAVTCFAAYRWLARRHPDE